MDITLAFMPDAYSDEYHDLASALTESGLAVEVLLLRSSESFGESEQFRSANPTGLVPGIYVRTLRWDDERGSRYLAHYYAAVYSTSSAIMIVGPGFQPDAETVLSMLELLRQDYDVVIASRHHKMSTLNYPLMRWVISKSYNWIASLLLGTHTTDATSGLKLYSREILIGSLGSATTRELTFQLEIIRRARRLGAEITEVPVIVEYQDSPYAVKASDITRTAVETVKLWWRIR